MESIKTQLLKNLDDITTKFDYQDENDQHILLESYADVDSAQYSMYVELTARTREDVTVGNYHSDRGDTEGGGIHYEISDITVDSVLVYKDGDELFNAGITKQEIYNSIKF